MQPLPPKLTVALLTVSGAFSAGCRPQPAAVRDQRPLSIVVSGDTAGWIVPCGCTSNQSGGLPRRATYLSGLAADADVIVADVGGAAHGKSPYDRLKFEAILQGERTMGLAAHNLGAAEAALGADYLRDVGRRLNIPFVSTNVVAQDGRPLAEPLRIVPCGGGATARPSRLSVAILGVLSPKFAGAVGNESSHGIRIDPPREAVLRTLQQAAGNGGAARNEWSAAIVLAYVPEEELLTLAEGLPEVDAVVGGPTGQTVAPRHVGPALVLSATRQGKFLARLDAPLQARGRWTGGIVELTDQFADDAAQVANVARFREELARRDIAASDTSFALGLPRSPGAPGADYLVAGAESCRDCHKDGHQEEINVWEKSAHARAWKSLVKQAAQADSDCQRCHTTAYGLPGGFVSLARSASLLNVGCENCHGPSRGHVRDPKVHTAYYGQAKNQCVACHDRENSPQFDFDTYWEKIKHGKPREKEGKKP